VGLEEILKAMVNLMAAEMMVNLKVMTESSLKELLYK
jgi:hypothetical protein